MHTRSFCWKPGRWPDRPPKRATMGPTTSWSATLSAPTSCRCGFSPSIWSTRHYDDFPGTSRRRARPGLFKTRSEMMTLSCTHLNFVVTDAANTNGCKECLEMGDTWVHLRLCRTCGHVGCCDESKNRHATKHFRATQHPIMTSLEPGEDWSWCYIDELTSEEHTSSLQS